VTYAGVRKRETMMILLLLVIGLLYIIWKKPQERSMTGYNKLSWILLI